MYTCTDVNLLYMGRRVLRCVSNFHRLQRPTLIFYVHTHIHNLICVFLINTCFWCHFITQSNMKIHLGHVQLYIIIYIEWSLFHQICLTDHCNDKIFNHMKILFHFNQSHLSFWLSLLVESPHWHSPIIRYFSFIYNRVE